MFANPILLIFAFLFSLSIHEAAHAYMADRLGDPTAKLAGRITFNPLAHLDPMGTLLPLFLLMTGSPIIFGWGKPVPFDPFNLRNPRRDAALISFAGPGVNLILAVFLSILIRLAHLTIGSTAFIAEFALAPIVALNVMWAIFNLLPVHPLDGGKVIVGLLPENSAREVDEFLHQYGLVILVFLIFPFFGFSMISKLVWPLVQFVLAILLPGTPLV